MFCCRKIGWRLQKLLLNILLGIFPSTLFCLCVVVRGIVDVVVVVVEEGTTHVCPAITTVGNLTFDMERWMEMERETQRP